MYKLKSRGPRRLPWAPPQLIFLVFERVSLTQTWKAFPDHLSYVIPSRLGVLYLVGGRVHLDDSESHRKGRSEMPFYLSEAPLDLNLATMSKFVLNKLVSKGMLFAQTAPKSNILLVL
ncbi:hypothetical protein TNCV_605161 [Trichonephila clavipes]|nr:hypothetical protein TNCV_605161 [Trichonephila clavipes]